MDNKFLCNAGPLPDEKDFYDFLKRASKVFAVNENNVEDNMEYDLPENMANQIVCDLEDVFPQVKEQEKNRQKLYLNIREILEAVRDSYSGQFDLVKTTIDYVDVRMEPEQADGMAILLKEVFAEKVHRQLKQAASDVSNIILAMRDEALPRLAKPSGPLLS